MDYAAARRAMVDSQLRPQAVTDPRVVAAMASVPREQFAPAVSREVAYNDRMLPLGGGRAMSAPATLGRMLVELAVAPGERTLVIGAGAGYASAVLVELGASVTAVESDTALAEQHRVLVPGVDLISGDLAEGAPAAAPFDVILIDGAVETIPETLIAQLAPDGRLAACLVDRNVQRLVIGRRAGSGFGVKSIVDAAAAPLPGFARPHAFTF